MKKIILFVTILLSSALLFAHTYDYGERVFFTFVVPNPSSDSTLTGTPVDADQDSVIWWLKDSLGNAIRDTALATDLAAPGVYEIMFTAPDTHANYNLMVRFKVQTNWYELGYATINIDKTFDASVDTLYYVDMVHQLAADIIQSGSIKNGALMPAHYSTNWWTAVIDSVAKAILDADWSDHQTDDTYGRIIKNLELYTNGSGDAGVDSVVKEIYLVMMALETLDSAKVYEALLHVFLQDPSVPDTGAGCFGDTLLKGGGMVDLPEWLSETLSVIHRGVDTTGIYVGKNGVITDQVSLHMKWGGYSGAPGDNLKEEIMVIWDSLYSIWTIVNAIGTAGTGENLVNIYVEDDEANLLTHLWVTMQDTVSGAGFIASTKAIGKAIFGLPDGVYRGLVYAGQEYTQDTIPQIFNISTNKTDTISLTVTAINRTKVYGYIRDGSGNLLSGAKVYAYIPVDYYPIYNEGTAIRAQTDVYTTGAGGEWYLYVYPNSALTESSPSDTISYWVFTATYQGQTIFTKEQIVPDSTTYLLPGAN